MNIVAKLLQRWLENEKKKKRKRVRDDTYILYPQGRYYSSLSPYRLSFSMPHDPTVASINRGHDAKKRSEYNKKEEEENVYTTK